MNAALSGNETQLGLFLADHPEIDMEKMKSLSEGADTSSYGSDIDFGGLYKSVI